MFKKHAIQMRFVKDDNTTPDNTEVTTVDPAEIAQIITNHTIAITMTVGGVVAANRVLKTICDIAVIAAKAKIK